MTGVYLKILLNFPTVWLLFWLRQLSELTGQFFDSLSYVVIDVI